MSGFLASIGAQFAELSTLELVALTILTLLALHLTVTIVLDRNKPAPQIPVRKSKPVPRAYTTDELAQRNGTNDVHNKAIWLAIKGKIYDVSAKPMFYGPGSSYGGFAGRDVTRAMALSSTDEKDILNSSIADVDDLSTLHEWIAIFDSKYDTVGWIAGSQAEAHFAKQKDDTSTATASTSSN